MTGRDFFSCSKLRDLGRNRSRGDHANLRRATGVNPFLPAITDCSVRLDASQPAQQQSPPPAPATPPAASNQQQPPTDNGVYVIRKDVDEVLLHATVVDDKQHIVTDLDRNDFSVFEDGKPQNDHFVPA